MLPRDVDINLGVETIDLRWGFDRLFGVITERTGRRPGSGAVFAFLGRRRTAMEVFYLDGWALSRAITGGGVGLWASSGRPSASGAGDPQRSHA